MPGGIGSTSIRPEGLIRGAWCGNRRIVWHARNAEPLRARFLANL